MRNKPGVIVQSQIALASEAIQDCQQSGMFLVDAGPHKLDDSDMVSRLASGTKSMAEHEPKGGLEHRFVRLLQASLFVKSENLVCGSELLVRTREETLDLRPVNGVRF